MNTHKISIISFIWLLSLILSIYMGYHQGSVNEKIQRLPFDLGVYLMMHEMAEYIHSSGKDGEIYPWNISNTEMLLYATLDFYDKNEKHFAKAKKDSPLFDERIEKARRATQGFKMTTIGSILQNQKGKRGSEWTSPSLVDTPVDKDKGVSPIIYKID